MTPNQISVIMSDRCFLNAARFGGKVLWLQSSQSARRPRVYFDSSHHPHIVGSLTLTKQRYFPSLTQESHLVGLPEDFFSLGLRGTFGFGFPSAQSSSPILITHEIARPLVN